MARDPREPIPAGFELRAPVSGAGILDPRSALLIWGFGSVVLGISISVLLVQGEVRTVVLLLLGVMGLLCLTPRRGLHILIVFLPFMYLLRRMVLNFQSFEARDPILLFPVVTTAAMFLGVLIFYAPRIMRLFSESASLKTLVVLLLLFTLQVFNPLQGGLLVGVGGGMYFIVPILWCAFGFLLSRKDMDRIFKIVITIGLITAIYGLKQHYLGLADVEVYELKSKQFYKTIAGSGKVRVMSSFASLGDFSLYLMVAGSLCFSFLMWNRRNLYYAGTLAICVFTMVWLSVRSTMLMLFFSMLVMLILRGNDKKQILVRSVAGLAFTIILYGTLYSYNPTEMYDTRFSANPYVVHTLSGITHPTQESTFQGRLRHWSGIVRDSVLDRPTGNGLGSTTTAASKFSGKQVEVDSYFFELFYGSSAVAALAFVILAFHVLRSLLGLCTSRPDAPTYRSALALLSGLFLGCVFGMAARDSITGPLMWLVIGWSIREDVDMKTGVVEPEE